MTDVEFKRRKSDAIDQRQSLNSLRQHWLHGVSKLTDTQYTLNQLPIVIAEKTELLRNELSTVEQRIAEINGRRAFVVHSAPISGRVSALQASRKLAEPNRLELKSFRPARLKPNCWSPVVQSDLFVWASPSAFAMTHFHTRTSADTRERSPRFRTTFSRALTSHLGSLRWRSQSTE